MPNMGYGRIRTVGELPENERVYLINGRRYRFTTVHMSGGYYRGYCPQRREWAYFTDEGVLFDDEEVAIRCERLK